MARLFVFGTLKRGFVYHAELGDAMFEGCALTRDAAFDLVEIQGDPHSYPGLISGTFHVSGEVYALRDQHLAHLDGFEEVGTLYERCEIEIKGFGPCWTYILSNRAALPTDGTSSRLKRDPDKNCVAWRG